MLTQALPVLDSPLSLVVSTGYPRQTPVETSSLWHLPIRAPDALPLDLLLRPINRGFLRAKNLIS